MALNVSPQQTEEHNLQAAKRRAEREAVDYKQRVLRSAPVFFYPTPTLLNLSIAWRESSRGCMAGSNGHSLSIHGHQVIPHVVDNLCFHVLTYHTYPVYHDCILVLYYSSRPAAYCSTLSTTLVLLT
jgi:hypothetical protein